MLANVIVSIPAEVVDYNNNINIPLVFKRDKGKSSKDYDLENSIVSIKYVVCHPTSMVICSDIYRTYMGVIANFDPNQ